MASELLYLTLCMTLAPAGGTGRPYFTVTSGHTLTGPSLGIQHEPGLCGYCDYSGMFQTTLGCNGIEPFANGIYDTYAIKPIGGGSFSFYDVGNGHNAFS